MWSFGAVNMNHIHITLTFSANFFFLTSVWTSIFHHFEKLNRNDVLLDPSRTHPSPPHSSSLMSLSPARPAAVRVKICHALNGRKHVWFVWGPVRLSVMIETDGLAGVGAQGHARLWVRSERQGGKKPWKRRLDLSRKLSFQKNWADVRWSTCPDSFTYSSLNCM